jgi:hypothetical protein
MLKKCYQKECYRISDGHDYHLIGELGNNYYLITGLWSIIVNAYYSALLGCKHVIDDICKNYSFGAIEKKLASILMQEDDNNTEECLSDPNDGSYYCGVEDSEEDSEGFLDMEMSQESDEEYDE